MSVATQRTALISVFDKTGVVPFAQRLSRQGFCVLSTSGTLRTLRDAGIPAEDVSEHTGYPELFGGRVKTLHPQILGGILARRGVDDDAAQAHHIAPIDLVAVNLYPFAEVVRDPTRTAQDAVENIDIGGVTLIRAAAKNMADVITIVDPADYEATCDALESDSVEQATRESLALKAFQHVARYDFDIARYLGRHERFPAVHMSHMNRVAELRYGENPHQHAALYREEQPRSGSIGNLQQLQGRELSFNNLADADAALACANSFAEPACAIVKHGNPCGVATTDSLEKAYRRAFRCDPTSAYGGIVAFNRMLDLRTMEQLVNNQFAEVVIAPKVADGVTAVAQQRKRLRLLTVGERDADVDPQRMMLRPVSGGALLQTDDDVLLDESACRVVSERTPSVTEYADLRFAWTVAKFVKSNAVVCARECATTGIGAGQMNRVLSVHLAMRSATEHGLHTRGMALGSDAFFPFRDGIDTAAAGGVTAVIQPGGSIRDAEVIEAANEHNIAMVFTGIRHFRH